MGFVEDWPTYVDACRRHCMMLVSARVVGAYVQAVRLKAPAHGQTMILTPGAARDGSPETIRL
jgi:hypothetical protein